jgi:hypothetical protein
LPQHFIRIGSGELAARSEDPNAALFAEWTRRSHGAKRDAVSRGRDFEFVPGFKVEFFPERFRDYDTACVVQCDRGAHIGIIDWESPFPKWDQVPKGYGHHFVLDRPEMA